MSRIPIRTRLTLVFLLAMALLLVLSGATAYLRMQADLDTQVNKELRASLTSVAKLVRHDAKELGDRRHDPLRGGRFQGFAQVVSRDGRVVSGTAASIRRRPILAPAELAALAGGQTEWVDAEVRPIGKLRVDAARVRDRKRSYTVVAAAPLAQHDEALASLAAILLIMGPLLLAAGAFTAYRVVAAALRPVESMRAEAGRMSADDAGARLPVPPARDEIARLGETLNRMLARVERAVKRERAFVSDASHELRTPLTILKTEIQLALATARSQEELEAVLRSAEEETDRLIRLAEDLLVLASLDDGRLPIRARPVELGEHARRVAKRFQPRANGQHRSIRVRASGDLRVRADPDRVEQALSNLLDNALRHGHGDVDVELSARGGSVTIHVRDDGPGLPEELLDNAFERFARGSGQRSRGGTGLGLAIVAAIAAAHGGRAGAGHRRAGGGVWIELPARTESGPGPDAGMPVHAVGSVNGAGRSS